MTVTINSASDLEDQAHTDGETFSLNAALTCKSDVSPNAIITERPGQIDIYLASLTVDAREIRGMTYDGGSLSAAPTVNTTCTGGTSGVTATVCYVSPSAGTTTGFVKLKDLSDTNGFNDNEVLTFDTGTASAAGNAAAGTATTANGAGTTLIDSAALFMSTDAIKIGMTVRNTTDGSHGVVTSIDSETQLTHTALTGGNNNWDSSDAYTFAADVRAWIQYYQHENDDVRMLRAQADVSLLGEWYDLGLGDGNSGQTVEFYCNDWCGALWIESGANTGVFNQWLNVESAAYLNKCGAGEIGYFFYQTLGNATLTFGNDINGSVIPNNARILAPNLIYGMSRDTEHANDLSYWDTSYADWTQFSNGRGFITANKVLFTSFLNNYTQTNYLDFDYVGAPRTLNLNTMQAGSDINQLTIYRPPNSISMTTKIGIINCGPMTLSSVFAWGEDNGNYLMAYSNGTKDNEGIVFNDLKLVHLETSNSRPAFNFYRSKDCVFNGVKVAGRAALADLSDCEIYDLEICAPGYLDDPINGGDGIVFTSCVGQKIDGVSLLTDGGMYDDSMMFFAGCLDVDVRNVGSIATPIDGGSYGTYGINWNDACTGRIARCYFTGFTFRAFDSGDSSLATKIWNCEFDGSDWDLDGYNKQARSVRAANGVLEGSGAIETDQLSKIGTHFADLFSSDTEGQLVFYALPASSVEPSASSVAITAGTPANVQPGWLMRTVGDQIEYSWQWDIIGHTAFRDAAMDTEGANASTHIAYTYDINIAGAGYSGNFQPVAFGQTVSESLTFSASGKTIVRDGGSSWTTSQYEDEMYVTITGSASNNGKFLIDSISTDTITLDAGEMLVNETVSCTATGGLNSEDLSSGFRIKVRATTITANSGTTIESFLIPTTTTLIAQQTNLYDLDLIDITLQNLEANSTYRIYNDTDAVLVESGTSVAGGDITIEKELASGKTLSFRIGGEKNILFTTSAVTTSTGASIYVSQVDDNFRDNTNDDALLLSTEVTAVGDTSVTISGTLTIQELYEYLMSWQQQTSQLEYASPISTADGATFILNTTDYSWSVTGSLIGADDTLSGFTAAMVGTGGYFQDITKVLWESGGSTYYASSVSWTFLDGVTPVVGAEVTVFDGSNNSLLYTTGMTLDEIETDGSGVATGLAVYQIDATPYTGHTLVSREYGFSNVSLAKTINGVALTEDIQMIADNFVTEATEATVAAYTGIALDYSGKSVTITTSGWTLDKIYDYMNYHEALEANLDEVESITSADGNTYTLADDWDLIVDGSGNVSQEAKTLVFGGTGALSTTSGGFFEDKTGAVWEAGGVVYYASHVYMNVKNDTTNANIQDAIIAFVETDSDTDQTFSTGLANQGLVTDASGNAEGYCVWKRDSTSYAGHNQYVGEYDYNWSTIPRTVSGAAIGSSGSRANVRILADANVVASKAAALAISGITVNHTTKVADLSDETNQNASDNLKARQARDTDIESGVAGYMSFHEVGLIIDADGSFFNGLSDWTYQNMGGTGVWKTGTIELDTPGTVGLDANTVTFDYITTGTYDHRSDTLTGTISLDTSNSSTVTHQSVPAVTVNNLDVPNITVDQSENFIATIEVTPADSEWLAATAGETFYRIMYVGGTDPINTAGAVTVGINGGGTMAGNNSDVSGGIISMDYAYDENDENGLTAATDKACRLILGWRPSSGDGLRLRAFDFTITRNATVPVTADMEVDYNANS